MNTALVYGVYAAVIVAAVAVTSCIKLIVKKLNGGEVGSVWEYLLSIISFLLAGGGAIAWLYFYAGMEWADISVLSTLAGTATYIVYLLLFQSTRKAGLAILSAIANRKKTKEESEEVSTEVESADTDVFQQVLDLLNKDNPKS